MNGMPTGINGSGYLVRYSAHTHYIHIDRELEWMEDTGSLLPHNMNLKSGGKVWSLLKQESESERSMASQ
jgi:hypothetical protein